MCEIKPTNFTVQQRNTARYRTTAKHGKRFMEYMYIDGLT